MDESFMNFVALMLIIIAINTCQAPECQWHNIEERKETNG